MIKLSLQRHHVEHAQETIFRYFNLLQLSNLNNVSGHGKISGEYLTVKLFNCLLQEVELQFKQKLIVTTGGTVRIKLSDAQAIALYKALLSMPVPVEQYFLSTIRNHWVQILDKEILKMK